MNTIENNKLIAEFMGVESYEFRGYTMFVFEEDNHRPHIDLHYHTDWNWLMKVVDKIESLDYMVIHNFYISKFEVVIKSEFNRVFKNIHITNKTKIEATYNACVEFIKWYNEQPK